MCPPSVVQGDDFPVQDRVWQILRVEGFHDLRELGVERHPAPAAERDFAPWTVAAKERDRAHAVPFDFEQPRRIVKRRVDQGGQHGLHVARVWILSRLVELQGFTRTSSRANSMCALRGALTLFLRSLVS